MLSDNLKRLRAEKGMSQEELANRLNVVRQTVSKWEKGLSVPDADMLMELSQIFDVKIEDLLSNGGDIKIIEKEHEKEYRCRMGKTLIKAVLIIAACLLVFMIIQTVFGLGVTVDTEITEKTFPIG